MVVPVYRNADTLEELATRVAAVAAREGLTHELVLVDDASGDGSASVALRLAAERPEVGTLALASNVGQHRAALEGLSHTRGRWVVVMDADLQDAPETIPDLLARARQGFDAVFAGRRGRYEQWHRLLTSRVFKLLLHVVAKVPRDAGMFFVASRRLVDELMTAVPARPWLVAMVGLAGLPITSVAVERRPRHDGRSGYSSGMRLRAALGALRFGLAWRLGHRPPAGRPPVEVAARAGRCADGGQPS